jgi:hypothetical protein
VTHTSAYSPIAEAARATSSPVRGSMRIAGVSTTAAPRSVRRAARPLACARARVTTTLRPNSGRRSSHSSSSRSRATEPTSVIAGGPMPACTTRSAMSASVPLTARWPGKVPRSTTATGSVGGRPPSIRRDAMRERFFTPM